MAGDDQCSCIIHRGELKSESKTRWWSSVWGFWKKKRCFNDSIQMTTLDDDEIYRNLCLAIQEGRSDYVKRAILVHSSLTEPETIQKLLMLALHRGMICIVDFLVEIGIDTLTLNDALLLSCKRSCLTAVEKLLNSGASVLSRNRYGYTCLHLAAERGDAAVDVISLLLKHGAEPSAQDVEGKTPLHVAVRVCGVESVRILAEAGANLNCIDKLGCSLLHEAMKRQIVFDRQDIAIVKHPKKAYLELVNFLVQRIPDIKNNIKLLDNKGNSCIHYAAQHLNIDHLKALRMLVEAGSPVNIVNRDGLTPLRLAVINRNIHVVQTLLELGADVDVKAPDGSTTLHGAVDQQNSNIVNLLLEFGADVDARTFDGSTPFQIALFWPETFLSLSTVVPLLQHGANIFFSAGYRPNPLVSSDVTDLFLKPMNYVLRILIYAATEKEPLLPTNDTNFNEWTVDLYFACVKEVRCLKSDRIGNCSFYKMLICETDVLIKYLKNTAIKSKFESKYHISQFKFYGPILQARYVKAVNRSELLNNGIEFFNCLFESGYPILPEECVTSILKYLKDSHLKKLQAVVLNRSHIIRSKPPQQSLVSMIENMIKVAIPTEL